MSDPITQEQMERLFARFFGEGNVNPAERAATESVEDFTKRIQESVKSMKQSISLSKTIMNIADGQKVGMIDVTDAMKSLDDEIKALEDTVHAHDDVIGKQNKENKIAAAKAGKLELAKNAALKNATGAVANFAVASIDIAFNLAMASMDFQKSLLSNASGVEIAGQASMALAKAEGEAAIAAANLTRDLGSVVSAFSGIGGKLGVAAAVIGTGMQVYGAIQANLAKKASELEQKRLDILKTALEAQRKSYMDITAAGIVLAGGMTQMRGDASRAGLTVEQFAKALKDSKDDLVFLGMGFGEASTKLSKVGAAIKNSGVDTQLIKLGYGFEEQASLAASMMANQKAAGDFRARTDAEVARETLAYGKSLKIISDITGKDAKKAAEKARTDAMRLEVSSKLTAEQNERFQGALRAMPEELQKGFIEKILTGGTVIDQNTNILLANNKQAGTYLDEAMNNVMNSSKTGNQVAQDTLAAGGKLGESLKTMDSTINTAGALVGGLAGQFGEFTNKLIMHTNYTEEAANKAKDNADKSANNMAALDVNVAALETGVQRLKVALQEELTGAITAFAREALAAAHTMNAIAGATMSMTETVWDRIGKSFMGGVGKYAEFGVGAGALVGGVAGGIGGTALMPGAGSIAGAAAGAQAGAVTGGVIAGVIGGLEGVFDEFWGGKKGKALGGVSDGPASGYMEKLHGTEAVVPLEGGRTIPVSLDMSNISGMINDIISSKSAQSGMAALGPMGGLLGAGMSMLGGHGKKDTSDLMQEQVDLMKQFIDTTTQQLSYLRETKDLQQQLVYNSH
jgi:hypothetical protein